jgi:hypothetical protein
MIHLCEKDDRSEDKTTTKLKGRLVHAQAVMESKERAYIAARKEYEQIAAELRMMFWRNAKGGGDANR